MNKNEQLLQERRQVYTQITENLRADLDMDELLWFIWSKMANIVRVIDCHPLQGDILGDRMSKYGWNHDLPYWCWHFIDLYDNEDRFDDMREILHYRELVESLKEAGTYRNAGSIWQRMIDDNDEKYMLKVIKGLDSLSLYLIPNTVKDICDIWAHEEYLTQKDIIKMKKAAIAEQKKTIKLSALLKSSLNFFPEL